jgi:hypothetical protein
MNISRRNIGVYVILSFLTCGIWTLVWYYGITKDLGQLKNDPYYRSPVLVVLFDLLTCGLYTLYWYYVTSQDLTSLDKQKRDNAAITLILGIFGFGIISLALMQNQLNDIARQGWRGKPMPSSTNRCL